MIESVACAVLARIKEINELSNSDLFYVYCTMHDEHIINTNFPTYMHNVVLFRRV